MTPNKPLDRSSWNDDEGEEMCKDIYDLQQKIMTKEAMTKMIRYSQRKAEAMMNSKMDGLKVDIMEGLKVLLQERHPESDNISSEIHEEDTEKVNHEWRNLGCGLQTNHIPRLISRSLMVRFL